MLALNTPSYGQPSGYQLSELPKPGLDHADYVVIKVHAASINPVDVKKASGMVKLAAKDPFPYKIGYDAAGMVTEIGRDVTRLKVGDEVYARVPEYCRGSCAEYVNCPERFVALKPPSLSWEEAASIPLAAMTALQALKKYEGDLAGKTVFITAGLSGTGLFACQLAKHVFRAGKVITTVSTSKIPKVPELLGEGTVDQIIDYTKTDPRDAIEHRTVDFLFDTVGQAMDFLVLMRPQTSRLVSVSTLPSGDQLQNSSMMQLPDKPTVPLPIRLTLNAFDYVRRLRAWRYGTHYSYIFLESCAGDLDALRKCVEEGKLKTVVGTTVDLRDIDAVRDACQVVFNGKGGLGKLVIKVVDV